MKIDMDQDFLDITVLTAEENLLTYILDFEYDDLEELTCNLEYLLNDLSVKRDMLFNNWVKERTPRVRFSQVRSSDNEVIPEYREPVEW